MIQNKSIGSKIFDTFNIIFMVLLSVLCLYPIWYAFCLSVSSQAATSSGLVTFYPIGFNLYSYQEIMSDANFFHSFGISVMRTILGVGLTMLVLVLMAYPLSKSKKEFGPRNILMWFVIFCMLFNGGTVPWYITMKNYGMINSIWGLVFGGSLPVFNLILLINFFKSIPGELEEAAIVDGANPWQILFKVVVPCAKPVLATVVLFVAVYHWNDYFQGLVLATGERYYPLQTYIKQFVVSTSQMASMTAEELMAVSRLNNKSLDAAKIFISMIPMLAVYPFLQKYFVNGIMLGSVKG